MSETLVGIIVGAAVALIGQILSYLSERLKKREEERRLAKYVIALLRYEIESHQNLYKHHLAWVQESIGKGGTEHTDYSYERANIDAYEKVFMAYWHILPDKILKPVMDYYGTVHVVNILAGDFGTPTPVPIIQAKEALEQAQHAAIGVLELLIQ